MPQRIIGLDSLRLLLALWVVFSHLRQGVLFNGPAAVLIFFIISGLCIHWPYRVTLQVPAKSFWVRRFIRIGIPTLVAVLLSAITQTPLKWILWSLVAELIYYTLYPALLALRRKVGWTALVGASGGVALALVVAYEEKQEWNFQGLGVGLTWVLGLPFWLLGCVLAEKIEAVPPRNQPLRVWTSRALLMASSVLSKDLVVRQILSYRASLMFVTVLGLFWLKEELVRFRKNPPDPRLEKLGQASFSLYLAHQFGLQAARALAPRGGLITELACAALAAAACYFALERPSHRLALRASRALTR